MKNFASSRSVGHASGFAGRPVFGVSHFRWVAFLCLLLSTVFAQAAIHRSQSWATTQFNKAESQRETLNGRSAQARTRREYETVIASYRRIVQEAPTSSKAEGSAFIVAELTAEMGRHFKDDMALYSAVREYKFLRREYPGSKHRVEALLAIGEIYKNDLGDDASARSTFEDFLGRYQHSDLVKEARAELASLQRASNDDQDQAVGQNSDDDVRAADSEPTAGNTSAKSALPVETSDKIVQIRSIKRVSEADYTRITINLEQDVRFESQRLDHPDRVFFDLENARLASRLLGSSLTVDDGRVKKIRMAQYKPGRARIVIETDGRASFNASLKSDPPRLVIDVKGNSAASETACADAASNGDCSQRDGVSDNRIVRASEKSVSTSAENASIPKKVIVEADADGQPSDANDEAADKPLRSERSLKRTGSKRAKTQLAQARPMREAEPTSDGDRSLIRTLGLRIGKIVIDPGHGGHDTGTIGPNGLLEKELVLDVSKRLGKLLASRLGAQVVFTRRDDTFIPLETRTSIANQEQADLFVSVHANSSHDPDARGVETYYLNFTSSPEALEVAARENAASDKSIHELQDLVKKIALKEKIEESREFASDVQGALHTGLATKNPGERNRGVKKAPFVVLIGANMPSILAEISFISNPGDERRLRTPEYRQRIAESLYRGISRYVDGLGGLKVASQIQKSSAD
ncbi:MAG TPA: N-acetylmuramoyl-L-alanine amidase [Terriglobales bacterium]|nr:N-acetylmuramoyl-L-alanine amidase [Terriglobales bacterium]